MHGITMKFIEAIIVNKLQPYMESQILLILPTTGPYPEGIEFSLHLYNIFLSDPR